MDFIDASEPFLDYSWMSVATAKPSKPSRRQNRCCDQCRKGKRACDAAVLEDSLLDTNGSTTAISPVFHYSDAFGALAQCGSCRRTKKKCTFEWLRSQRGSQAALLSNITPPTKKRRTQSSPSGMIQTPSDLALDYDGDVSISDTSLMTLYDDPAYTYMNSQSTTGDDTVLDSVFEDHNYNGPDRASTQGSSLGVTSQCISESPIITSSRRATRNPQSKRRRWSSGTTSNISSASSSLSLANNLLHSTNNIFLTEGLLKIYHDSFENALACWLTERTCPYSKGSEEPLTSNASPGWNRIYHRVFRLDRLASPIRGRNLTQTEDKAASKAINLAVFSFATQWAQSNKRSRSKYLVDGGAMISPLEDEAGFSSPGQDFDRTLQVSAWNEARIALQDAAEIESFRVVLAQIVFSLTQKPIDQKEAGITVGRAALKGDSALDPGFLGKSTPDPESPSAEETGLNECGDWLTRLDLTLEGEGPPIHLEQGLRLIHSLRSRMVLSGAANTTARDRLPPGHDLNVADKDTVDLLFWLGIMFDTLSSAMHKRPLVVSDEDSDVYPNEEGCNNSETSDPVVKVEGLWDNYIFARQHTRLQDPPVRWPCSRDQASSLLRDAAPVKVLLFRKITRIQTLLSRPSKVRGLKIEKAIAEALEVYHQWNTLYAPFIQDCINNHDNLPAQIQSWYICLTGHWHLATLLLADLLEIIDTSESGLSEPLQHEERKRTNLVATLREKNCHALSDLARCACPRDDASFPRSREFHFAVNQGALLTEPWTAVLIRAYAKAGSILLASTTSVEADIRGPRYRDEALRRADDCCQALFYLGKKSDQALSAAKILGDALRLRQNRGDEQVRDMGNFLEAELWEGFEDMNAAFGVEGI